MQNSPFYLLILAASILWHATPAFAESPPFPEPALPAEPPLPQLKVYAQTTFVSQNKEAKNCVIRSADELREAGLKPEIAAKLKLDEIDFTAKMVVIIESGMTNAFGVRLRLIEALADHPEVALIHWEFKPYFGGAAPPNQPGNPTLVLVLDHHKGDVEFRRKNWKWPKDLPPPPSAPPGGLPPGRPSE